MAPRPTRPKTAYRPKRVHRKTPPVKDYEHKQQSTFFSVLEQINHRAAKKCTYSHQNGFLRTKSMRLRAWKEGAKKGTPDVFVRYPSQGKHGLYIEFKTPGREATPEQIDFMKEAEIDGYATALVFSWEEALNVFCTYVGIAVDIQN